MQETSPISEQQPALNKAYKCRRLKAFFRYNANNTSLSTLLQMQLPLARMMFSFKQISLTVLLSLSLVAAFSMLPISADEGFQLQGVPDWNTLLLAKKAKAVPVADPLQELYSKYPGLLKSQVRKLAATQSLSEALINEGEKVNWYQWYLDTRKYLKESGGILCPAETYIIIKNDGSLEPLTGDIYCIQTTMDKRIELPTGTELTTVNIVVRDVLGPAVSKDQILSTLPKP